MITNDIKFGGTIYVGDFILIGDGYVNYGWYSGNGKAGNIQFINPRTVNYSVAEYNDRIKNSPISSKDKKGFNLDHIGKYPIRNTRKHFVIKITDPEAVLTGHDLTEYLKAKETLTQIKFLKP